MILNFKANAQGHEALSASAIVEEPSPIVVDRGIPLNIPGIITPVSGGDFVLIRMPKEIHMTLTDAGLSICSSAL